MESRVSEIPTEKVDVLVVAAHAPDLAGMRAALGENLNAHIRGLFVCGKAIGIGAPMAAVGMTGRIKQLAPRAVVMIGTCAVYPGQSTYRPNDVVVANRFTLVDPNVLAQRASFPAPMQTTVEAPALMCQGIATIGNRARMAPIASTLGSTTDDALAAQLLAATGCEAENLEAYSVALACSSLQIPFACVFGVSNVAGSRASEDWRQFHRSAVTAAADVLTNWVHAGAPGMPHH